MKRYPAKNDSPVENVRRYLEPGPIVMVSSRWKGRNNIMTMGWHTMMEFTPALLGCIIAGSNHSFGMIRNSRECVINLPTADLIDTVVRVGNTSGIEVDKFAAFGLTPADAEKVKAPLIRECHANFECRLYDGSMIDKYNFFIFRVVKAHVAPLPKYPRTLHYTGGGVFMIAGRTVSRRPLFRPGML